MSLQEMLSFAESVCSSPLYMFPGKKTVHARGFNPLSGGSKYGDSAEQAWLWLCRKTGAETGQLRLFELPQLLHTMSDALGGVRGTGGGGADSLAEAVLDASTFHYESGLKCEEYHSEKCDEADEARAEWPNESCSLARARNFAALMCTHVCPMLDLEFLPGRHVPPFKEAIEPNFEYEQEDDQETMEDDDEESDLDKTRGSRSLNVTATEASLATLTSADLSNMTLDSTLDSTMLNTTLDDVTVPNLPPSLSGVSSRGRGRGVSLGVRSSALPPPPKSSVIGAWRSRRQQQQQ